jgi:hypothetical protein
MYINTNSGIILMPRGEDALRMRPSREEIGAERAKEIMASTPVKTEKALSEESMRRRHD